jgi:hypothetical protein
LDVSITLRGSSHYYKQPLRLRDNGNGLDFESHGIRHEARNLDRRRDGWSARPVFIADFLDGENIVHRVDKDGHLHNIIERGPGLSENGAHLFKDTSRLGFRIPWSDGIPPFISGSHAGREDQIMTGGDTDRL